LRKSERARYGESKRQRERKRGRVKEEEKEGLCGFIAQTASM